MTIQPGTQIATLCRKVMQMVIQIDEAARNFHSSRKICNSSCNDVIVHLLEATCHWPGEAPKPEPIPIDRLRSFRRNSPPPPPEEFWMMNLDPAC